MAMAVLCLFLGVIFSVGAGWLLYQFLDIGRDDALDRLARRLSMDFRFGLPEDLRETLPRFRPIHDAMERGEEFQAGLNSITGLRRGRRVAFFDYQYVKVVLSARSRSWSWRGPREHRWTRRASAVAAELGFSSPPLVIRPEGWADKVAGLLGYEDIDFSALPEFSRRFYVNGPDRLFARRLITPLLAGFMVDQVRCAVDLCGPWLLLYGKGRFTPRRAGDLINMAAHLADLVTHEFERTAPRD